jgi:TRAP-type C4-dicarboxylate transport system permease small subunit
MENAAATPEPEPVMRVYGRLLRGFAIGAAAIVALMLVGVTLDVLLRNVLVTGVHGIVEYTEFGLYLATVLAAPWLLHQGHHIRADVMGQWATGVWLKVIDIFADAVGLAVCIVVGWYALQSALESHALGSLVRRTVEFPEWWLIAPLPPVMALLAVEFALRLGRTLTSPSARHQDARSAA